MQAIRDRGSIASTMKKPAIKIASPVTLIERCVCVVACKGKCRRPKFIEASVLAEIEALTKASKR